MQRAYPLLSIPRVLVINSNFMVLREIHEMKKTIYVAVIALFGFGALASTPALANCASELDTVAQIL